MTGDLLDILPDQIEMNVLTHKSILPFKVASISAVLVHRIAELSKTSLNLYDEKKYLPAFILTRSVVETAALLYCLHIYVETFHEDHDADKLNKLFLKRVLTGCRFKDAKYQAYSAITAVQKLDKVVEGIYCEYEELSEFLHPNWSGAMGAFGKIDQKISVLELGKEQRSLKPVIGLLPFSLSLFVAIEYYKSLLRLIQEMNEYFEGHVGREPM